MAGLRPWPSAWDQAAGWTCLALWCSARGASFCSLGRAELALPCLWLLWESSVALGVGGGAGGGGGHLREAQEPQNCVWEGIILRFYVAFRKSWRGTCPARGYKALPGDFSRAQQGGRLSWEGD